MRQTTNVLRKEYSANTVLVVRLLWGRSRGCAMDWDELAVTDEGLEGEGFRDRGWRGWVGMRAWVGGWWCHQSRAGGNHLPRGIIGGLGNLNISSLSHLPSSPVLKNVNEKYWKGRRIYFCPSAKVSSITHSIVNRESAVSIKTHFKKNCIWSYYYSSNTFPTYFNTFSYFSKLRKTALCDISFLMQFV